MSTSKMSVYSVENISSFVGNSTSTMQYFNATVTSSSDDATALKIASIAFSIVASLFLSYIILVSCYHSYKTKSMIRWGDDNWYTKNKEQTLLNSFIILAAFAIFVYVVVELPLVVPPTDAFCAFYFQTRTIAYAISVFVVYFALWCRVYASFYSHPVLRQATSRWLRVTNTAAIVFLVVMVAVNLGIFLSAPVEVATRKGCKSVESKGYNVMKYILLVTTVIIFQVTLLISFLHPLNMHGRKMLNSGIDAKSTMAIVKRSAIVAIVCIVSDIFTSGFAVIYKSDTIYMKHTVMTCNLTINLLGVILSFANWKEKIMPFKQKSRSASTPHKQKFHGQTVSSSEVQATYSSFLSK